MVLPRTRAEAFNRRTLLRMTRRAREKSRPLVPSRTLRNSMQVFIDRNQVGILQIPYFWALYVHDGRGGYGVHNRPRSGGRKQPSVLVWFKNPKDDPRTRGGQRHPRREQDILQLTEAQYRKGLKRNKERAARGQEPYMIVVKRVNKKTTGKPFFSQGLANLEVGDIALEEFDKFVRAELFGDEDTVHIRI